MDTIRSDLERFAHEYGPADLVFADHGPGVPDGRLREVRDTCRRLSDDFG